MLVVGLTGGIASGKTAVAERFAAHAVPVIDTDRIARELVEPGTECLRKIVERFGETMLDAAGRLDRPALRRRIFEKEEDRRWLERLLHPRIRAAVLDRLAGLRAPYAVVVVPLLFESGFDSLVDRVLVVDAPVALQTVRLMERDGIDRSSAQAMLAAQMDREARLRRADDVIRNDSDPAHLDEEVRRLDERYRRHPRAGM